MMGCAGCAGTCSGTRVGGVRAASIRGAALRHTTTTTPAPAAKSRRAHPGTREHGRGADACPEKTHTAIWCETNGRHTSPGKQGQDIALE